jgi:hypothetical protein
VQLAYVLFPNPLFAGERDGDTLPDDAPCFDLDDFVVASNAVDADASRGRAIDVYRAD